jgi:hypothetical protein
MPAEVCTLAVSHLPWFRLAIVNRRFRTQDVWQRRRQRKRALRMLADVLRKERITVRHSAIVLHATVPYRLVRKILDSPHGL